MARSKRSVRTENWWRSVMVEFGCSGETVRAFCSRKEIAEGSFFAWRKRLSEGDNMTAIGVSPNGGPMIPVEVVPEKHVPHRNPPSTALAGGLEIVTPGGFRLRFDRSLEASHLCELLRSVLRVESGADSC